LADRAIQWPLPTSGNEPVYPTLYNISARLPRYIRLDIDASGNVTPSIPSVPHVSLPKTDGTDDIPVNGAVVWLTTGNAATDFELDPDIATGRCSSLTIPVGAIADGDLHGVVVYAIGYVGGRPSSIIRAQIK